MDNRYDLIIFDFDGTLADTRLNIIRTLQATQRQLGYDVSDDESCAATIGLTLENAFLRITPGADAATGRKLAEAYRIIFEENKKLYRPTVFPGVRTTLEQLKAKGIALTIASSRNSLSLHNLIEELGLDDLIGYVVGGDDVTDPKPGPGPVLKTLAELGFSPARTLVVGDMTFDILMGQRAGVDTCAVTYGNGSRSDLSSATYLIDSFPDLLSLT